MVHYTTNTRHAVQTPPPTCPRCGSHRTEIVGRSDDSRTVTLRCNSCGERSTPRVEKGKPEAEMINEIEAIRVIGQALAQFQDPVSCTTVLR